VSLAVDQIRSRVILGALASLGAEWRESRIPYDLFPSYDSRTIEHKALCVGILSTDFLPSRQSSATGIPATTRLGLRWAWRLRVDGLSDDYTAALVGEQTVCKALAGLEAAAGNPGLRLHLISASRRVVAATESSAAAALFVGDIQCEIVHHYPIA